jgi:large subunit ribosomal protein L28
MPGRRILREVPVCRVKAAAIQDWSFIMAAKCDICGKGPQFGNNVSHANNTTRRRWNVNLHPVKAVVAGASKRIRVCSGCIKTGKVVKG